MSDIIKGIDKLIDECYGGKNPTYPELIVFQRGKFLNKLLPLLDSLGVVRKVENGDDLTGCCIARVESLIEPFLE